MQYQLPMDPEETCPSTRLLRTHHRRMGTHTTCRHRTCPMANRSTIINMHIPLPHQRRARATRTTLLLRLLLCISIRMVPIRPTHTHTQVSRIPTTDSRTCLLLRASRIPHRLQRLNHTLRHLRPILLQIRPNISLDSRMPQGRRFSLTMHIHHTHRPNIHLRTRKCHSRASQRPPPSPRALLPCS